MDTDVIKAVSRAQFIAECSDLVAIVKKRGVTSVQALGLDMMRENALAAFDAGERTVFCGRRFTPIAE